VGVRGWETRGGKRRVTYVRGGLGSVDSRAVEQEAHSVGLQCFSGAEGVEDLAGRNVEARRVGQRSRRRSTVSLGEAVEG